MKLPKRILCASLVALSVTATVQVQAQEMKKENTIDLSRKARRGYLASVTPDDSKQEAVLQFVTKSKRNHIKVEDYRISYDLELIEQTQDEIPIEKARGKFSWFKFKGEEYVTDGITAEGNMMGTAVFRKKQTTFKWSWFAFKYVKRTKVLEKIKPKTDDGKKFFFYSSVADDEKGEIVTLLGKKGKLKEPAKHMQEYVLMKLNSNLDIVSEVPVTFSEADGIQQVLYTGEILNEESDPEIDNGNDWAVIFAPAGGQGLGKFEGSDAAKYTYLRVDREGKVVQQTSFNTKGNMWQIKGIYENKGKVIAYGPCQSKKVESSFMSAGDMGKVKDPELKQTDFQLVCFEGNSTKYVSLTSIDRFKEIVQRPEGQKKGTVYNGKTTAIGGLQFAKNGDLYIIGQDFKKSSQLAAKAHGDMGVRSTIYGDLYLFKFDNSGQLKNFYSINNKAKKGGLVGSSIHDARMYMSSGEVIESPDGKMATLLIREPFYVDEIQEENWDGSKTITVWPRYHLKSAKINNQSGEIEDFKEYGEKKYVLYDRNWISTIDNDSKILFLGESKNGKEMWLGRFDMN